MSPTDVLAWHDYHPDGSGIPRSHPLYYLAIRGIRRILDSVKGTEFDHESRFQTKEDEMCQGFKNWLTKTERTWDVLIEAPSSAPYAASFARAVSSMIASRVNLRTDGKVKAGDDRIDEDDILKGILPLEQHDREVIAQAERVLIVDDVYAEGKTARAVERFLRLHGLAVKSTITVAVPLRVYGAKPSLTIHSGG